MINRRTFLLAAGAAGALPVLPEIARADTWPSRPVKVIVPYPPGGSTDITARLVMEKVAPLIGQPVVIDNRAGAGGNLGMDAAARSAPDGYTFAVATTAHAINMTLFTNLTYHILDNFTPVALLTENPLMLVVPTSSPFKTVKDLIAAAKAEPGKINFATSGVGQSTHLAAELFATMAGIKMTHVPYKGSAPAIADVIAGHVQLIFDTTQSALPYVKEGRLRALGVTSSERIPLAPDVPTIAEAGLPGYEATAWNGLVAPKGTPAEIVTRMNAEVEKVLALPEVKTRFADLGAVCPPSTPESFRAYVAAQITKWGAVVKASGAKVD